MKSVLLSLVVLSAVVACSPGATIRPDATGSPDPSSSAWPSAPPSPSTAAVAPTTTAGNPIATRPAHQPAFEHGLLVATVADRLRVRSKPVVASDSILHEPTLPVGTMLHVLDGPVAGSGYSWYRVELTEGQALFGGIREGWVAAAAKDGTPWLGVYADVDPGPTFPPVKAGWPSVRLGDVSLQGESGPGESGRLEVSVEIHGRLPGSVEFVTARGDYFNEWYCGGGSGSEIGVTWLDDASGTADLTTEVTIAQDGIGTTTIRLPADAPTQACPDDFPGPKFPAAGRWTDVKVTVPAYGLQLTVPIYEWADTF